MHSRFFQQLAARWLHESRSVIYLEASQDGRLKAWNPAVSLRFGRTADQLRDLDLDALVAGGDLGLLSASAGAGAEEI
ncbi:MAG: hypothetical protein WD013_00395, partial [Gemmatimonadota bacterium]